MYGVTLNILFQKHRIHLPPTEKPRRSKRPEMSTAVQRRLLKGNGYVSEKEAICLAENREKSIHSGIFNKTIIREIMNKFERLVSKETKPNKKAFKNIQKTVRSSESLKEQQPIQQECSEK